MKSVYFILAVFLSLVGVEANSKPLGGKNIIASTTSISVTEIYSDNKSSETFSTPPQPILTRRPYLQNGKGNFRTIYLHIRTAENYKVTSGTEICASLNTLHGHQFINKIKPCYNASDNF